MSAHVVHGLMQAAAEGDIHLLKAAANCEQGRLVLDRRPDEGKGQRVTLRIECIRQDRFLLPVVLGRNVRPAAGQQDGIGYFKDGPDIRHAWTDRHMQRLALRHLGNSGGVFASHGVKNVAFDQCGAGLDDDDRSAHAASSPATSLSVRSRARAITSSASSNWSCVQINGGAVTIVSNTARMMKPSRKK